MGGFFFVVVFGNSSSVPWLSPVLKKVRSCAWTSESHQFSSLHRSKTLLFKGFEVHVSPRRSCVFLLSWPFTWIIDKENLRFATWQSWRNRVSNRTHCYLLYMFVCTVSLVCMTTSFVKYKEGVWLSLLHSSLWCWICQALYPLVLCFTLNDIGRNDT